MPWSQLERRITTILGHFAPNLIIFEPLVLALYNFFSKTNTWGIISIYLSIKIKSKHFLRFLMSWSQRERHIATIYSWFGPNLNIFEPLVSALYNFFFKKKSLGHYLHSYVYKIKLKHFLHFLMPWSQRERRIETILRHFAPNLIIFEPLVSAL